MVEYVLLIVPFDRPFDEGTPLSFSNYKQAFKISFSLWRFECWCGRKHSCFWLHSSSGWVCISDLFWDMSFHDPLLKCPFREVL